MVLCFFLIPLSSNSDFTIEPIDMLLGTVAGALMCTARVLIAIAFAIGLAAPAEALISTAALYQTLYSAIFAEQSLNLLQTLGLLFGVAGVFFLAFLDECVNRIKKRRQIRQLKL